MAQIATTPAVRRFNAAVERADSLLNFAGDRLSASDLVLALMNRNFWLAECGRAALELEAAAKELNQNRDEGDDDESYLHECDAYTP